MPDLNLTRLREIAESGIAAGADKPGTYYGPLVTALDPLPVTTLALIDEVERLRGQANSVRGILERSPDCNKYPDESVLHCGWKSDLNAIRETLNGAGAGEGDA